MSDTSHKVQPIYKHRVDVNDIGGVAEADDGDGAG